MCINAIANRDLNYKKRQLLSIDFRLDIENVDIENIENEIRKIAEKYDLKLVSEHRNLKSKNFNLSYEDNEIFLDDSY